ncbi:DUF1071 domain-containing protein [Candidatus Arsenophonus triatominarum]|uniref:Sak single strand annealing protein n=1 Tax=Candidatus Arsenophonus triatominarum TaxID=57911 RepID=UPI0007C57BAE|nr:DUF1071 domain-containing protein [Candidatus Arsenophonus triatominarum]
MSETQHTEKERSFQQQVWETLSVINVNDKVEKKNGLSYLSWGLGMGVLMAHYPESYYVIDAISYNNDGSAMVSLTLTVKQGNNEFPEKCGYPLWITGIRLFLTLMPLISIKRSCAVSPRLFQCLD